MNGNSINNVDSMSIEDLRMEVEKLRNDKEQLLKYCNHQYFKELWLKGFVARSFCENRDVKKCNHICDHIIVEEMEELWERDRHDMFVEEMNELGLEIEEDYLKELRGE